MITVVGSINIDLVATVGHAPGPGETTVARDYQVHHGGKGANQAVAAARLGAPVRFVGAVGDDDFGGQLLSGLDSEGIDTQAIKRVSGSSGIALITVEHGGENRIIVIPGANGTLAADALSPAVFEQSSVVLLQLETPPAFVAAAIDRAHDAGAEVVLNAAPAASLDALDMARVNWLMVNAGEAAYLLDEIESTDLNTARRHGQMLAGKFATGVVLTLGRQGALWIARDGSHGHAAAFDTNVVDTTGAGDTFAGAFAVARMQNRSIEDAIRRAAAAGALSVRRQGAQAGMPSAAELEQLMADAAR
ncbi:MAG: ribokinase [Salinisphaera sp.]|jgi:ribokinase|nr:ribokinase [Salinisphaera sp.]